MAPPTKRTRVEMAESSNKRMKPSETLPEDLLEHIMSTYLPVQSLLTTRVLSKRFRETKVRSLYQGSIKINHNSTYVNYIFCN
ncbi:putative F-box-like domain superfamily protein [Arabidopsis thaliana]